MSDDEITASEQKVGRMPTVRLPINRSRWIKRTRRQFCAGAADAAAVYGC